MGIRKLLLAASGASSSCCSLGWSHYFLKLQWCVIHGPCSTTFQGISPWLTLFTQASLHHQEPKSAGQPDLSYPSHAFYCQCLLYKHYHGFAQAYWHQTLGPTLCDPLKFRRSIWSHWDSLVYPTLSKSCFFLSSLDYPSQMTCLLRPQYFSFRQASSHFRQSSVLSRIKPIFLSPWNLNALSSTCSALFGLSISSF